MRKYLSLNKLRAISGAANARSYRASAFSLAELVVALGILVLMFALAGQVFNVTVQSTGQATAIVQVNQQLRAFEQTLRDDLAFVQKGGSVMLIQGNPVNAYWTRDNKEADDDANPATGYPMRSDAEREYFIGVTGQPAPPRADMLMFFTARKANSYTDSAVTASLHQVVYGHAELGEYVVQRAGGATTYKFEKIVGNQGGQTNQPMFPLDVNGYPSPTTTCLVPASEWHLARRNVLIAPTYDPRMNPPGINIQIAPITRLDDPRLLDGSTDIIASFYLPPQPPTFTCPTGCPPFNYDEDVLRPATVLAYAPPVAPIFLSWQLPRIFVQSSSPFRQNKSPYARSLLDVTPPPALARRLGHYLMPNCASFKVEWTLDPRSSFVAGRLDGMTEVLWFDPGHVKDTNQFSPNPGMDQDDPLLSLKVALDRARNDMNVAMEFNLRDLLETRTAHPDGRLYSLTDRFRAPAWDTMPNPAAPPFPPIGSDGRSNTVAFVANRERRTNTQVELVPDDVFPSALRITVDLYDRQGRLDRPVRHVMVIPVGR